MLSEPFVLGAARNNSKEHEFLGNCMDSSVTKYAATPNKLWKLNELSHLCEKEREELPPEPGFGPLQEPN